MARIAIYGAGAVGSVMAAKLARAGHQVSVIARGAHLEAMQRNGLEYIADNKSDNVRVTASEYAEDFGVQDVVICTLKSHAIAGAAQAISLLLGPDTPVIFAQNGLPWWYFKGRNAPGLDTHGVIARHIGVRRTLGCIIHCPSHVIAPGVVKQEGNSARYYLGEPEGGFSARLLRLEQSLAPALPVIAVADIRYEVWRKLRINVASSLLTTLTMSLPADVMNSAILHQQFRQLLMETGMIAAAHNVTLPEDVSDIIQNFSHSRHAPSMLQDLLTGRTPEVEAQLIAVQQLARAAEVATPTLDILLALLLQRLEATGMI
ncbi:2-dehydropantoate 2-reductase [Pantoea cypripedii]|uniref:ketopantoate reductase family protein n=1 Tax=Pantoea cypripedii TaxID=55209 RepID=UPI002FCBA572